MSWSHYYLAFHILVPQFLNLILIFLPESKAHNHFSLFSLKAAVQYIDEGRSRERQHSTKMLPGRKSWTQKGHQNSTPAENQQTQADARAHLLKGGMEKKKRLKERVLGRKWGGERKIEKEEGEREGRRREEWKKGRKERWTEWWRKEQEEGRGSVKRGKIKGWRTHLTLELPRPPCPFSFPLYFQNISWDLTRHPAPSSRLLDVPA